MKVAQSFTTDLSKEKDRLTISL